MIIADRGYLLIVPIPGLIIVSVINFSIIVVSVIIFRDCCFHDFVIEGACDCNGCSAGVKLKIK
jgi:hypothetical protein